MTKRILLFIFSFVLMFQIIGASKITVSASGSLSGFNEWTEEDKKMFWQEHWFSIIAQCIGVVINPYSLSYNDFMSMFEDISADRVVADESTNYEEYIIKRLSLDDNNLIVDNELSDLLYETSIQYIEEETDYIVHKTAHATSVINHHVDIFKTNTQYKALINYINSADENIVFYIGSYNVNHAYKKSDETIGYALQFYEVDMSQYNLIMSGNGGYYVGASLYDNNWNFSNDKKISKIVREDGIIDTLEDNSTSGFSVLLHGYVSYYSVGNFRYLYMYYPNEVIPTLREGYSASFLECPTLISKNASEYRIYDSLDAFKQYSVGQRPYYITDKFQDYDINGDNSCIVTESDLSNGSVYGDVYNYIINNYDNPDSLTEDELRDILNDYFGQGSGNDNGNGNNNGSDNSGSGGNGLSGFLSGLGSIGDAILSILGKLLEYVGKAVELLSGTVTKVLDIVPKSITDLFGAFFSFLPEECMTYIELGLALGVILAIVGAFKK